MSKTSKGKKKAASSKGRQTKAVKVKDLPAKRLEDREVLGGSLSASNLTLRNPSLGPATLIRNEALNLGL